MKQGKIKSRERNIAYYMDIVRFKGGLGNQMFQYALIEALRFYGRKVGGNLGFYRKHSDVRPFILDKVFQGIELNEVSDRDFESIDHRWIEVKQNDEKYQYYKKNPAERFFYVEDNVYHYDENVFKARECTYVGYWQTERYFKNIRDKILQSFEFDVNNNMLKELGKKLTENYVGVHIRRGDYLSSQVYYACNVDYYKRAIEVMKRKIGNARFIFFSDDMKWVYDQFHMEDALFFDATMVSDYQDWYDMYLMTKCCANIIANSSFSWWGAWLNQNTEKVTISPKIWLNGRQTPDIWCDKWIKL